MSDVLQPELSRDDAPQDADRAISSGTPVPSDLFALTKALVFTKESYRILRAKAIPRPRPPVDEDASSRVIEAVFPPRPARVKPDPALTPWDLMDEEDSPEGITFSLFQRRPHAIARPEAA